jgi:hypothetical protein
MDLRAIVRQREGNDFEDKATQMTPRSVSVPCEDQLVVEELLDDTSD